MTVLGSPFPPRLTASGEIAGWLRARIIQAHLLPGHRLSENDLARDFGTSRTPVREALQQLKAEGLVNILPQRGSFVASIDLEEVESNYFIRETLECRLVELAAERSTPQDAKVLMRIIDDQKAVRNQGPEGNLVPSDDAFHAALMSIAGHPKVWQTVHQAKGHLDRIRHIAVQDPTRVDGIIDDHMKIVRAVIDNRPQDASDAMRAHLRNIFKVIERVRAHHQDYFAA